MKRPTATIRFLNQSLSTLMIWLAVAGLLISPILPGGVAFAAGPESEITPESEEAVELGLEWLAKNQGPRGNWDNDDLGLVAMGALAFLAAGHTPGKGKYGENVQRALDYVVSNSKPSGLMNIANEKRDMYNHGLAAFVLTQAYGMSHDERLGPALERALRLISDVQCRDGGWDYVARRQDRGHDLSLVVMQAKALRGATDVGFEIPPRTIDLAIQRVRGYYRTTGKADGRGADYGDHPLADQPGQFTYNGGGGTIAMAAAGVVCLQEFGQYDDFRIGRSMDVVHEAIAKEKRNWMRSRDNKLPFDGYTLYYVAQAIYQVGGKGWEEHYPTLRDALVHKQKRDGNESEKGAWEDGNRLRGKAGQLYGTSVAVFTLSIPNRYLPILQPAPDEDRPDAQAQAEAQEAEAKSSPRSEATVATIETAAKQ